MIAQQSDQFVLRDINTGAEQALSEPAHWAMDWDACCATSTRGTLLYVGVRRSEQLYVLPLNFSRIPHKVSP